jgi:hypothetical protein
MRPVNSCAEMAGAISAHGRICASSVAASDPPMPLLFMLGLSC